MSEYMNREAEHDDTLTKLYTKDGIFLIDTRGDKVGYVDTSVP
jgi:hypothetical protein